MKGSKKDLKFRLGLLAAATLFGALAYAEVTMQTVSPGQVSTQTMTVARYVTNVVMNSSSNWERVDATLPDQVYYKLAIESVTVTGGVRRFETKDYYINVSVTNFTTNVAHQSLQGLHVLTVAEHLVFPPSQPGSSRCWCVWRKCWPDCL